MRKCRENSFQTGIASLVRHLVEKFFETILENEVLERPERSSEGVEMGSPSRGSNVTAVLDLVLGKEEWHSRVASYVYSFVC